MNLHFYGFYNYKRSFPKSQHCKSRVEEERVHFPRHAERKAEDFPLFMGSSTLMSWSPYVKCMMIRSQDNRKVASKSPFKINRELIRILGAERPGVTKQRNGNLMVELRIKEHERKLGDVSSFLEIPVTVGPHHFQGCVQA